MALFDVSLSDESSRTETTAPESYVVTATAAGIERPVHESVALRELLAACDPTRSSTTGSAAGEHERCERIGKALFATVFRGNVRDSFEIARERAIRGGDPLCVRFTFGAARELHEMPWECIHDETGYLALDRHTPVLRRAGRSATRSLSAVAGPLRVLWTSADKEDQERLALPREQSAIRELLGSRQVKSEFVAEPDVDVHKLRKLMFRAQGKGQPFHVWHHAGHGRAMRGAMAFAERGSESTHWADTKSLAALAGQCDELRLAVVNACQSARALGLATRLAHHGVPAVVGFRGDVPDDQAQLLAEVLYENLATQPLEVAVTEARLALAMQDAEEPFDWANIVLFLQVPPPARLFGNTRPADASTSAQPRRRPHPPARTNPPQRPGTAIHIGTVVGGAVVTGDQPVFNAPLIGSPNCDLATLERYRALAVAARRQDNDD